MFIVENVDNEDRNKYKIIHNTIVINFFSHFPGLFFL